MNKFEAFGDVSTAGSLLQRSINILNKLWEEGRTCFPQDDIQIYRSMLRDCKKGIVKAEEMIKKYESITHEVLAETIKV